MSIEVLRHSIAHILAATVQELYPGTKFGIKLIKIAKEIITNQGLDRVFESVILKSVNLTALLWFLPNDGSFLLS